MEATHVFVFMCQQKIFTSSFGCLWKVCGRAAAQSPWKHFFPPFCRSHGRMKQMLHVTYGRQAGAAHFGSVDRIYNWQTGRSGIVRCYFTLLRCSKPLFQVHGIHTQAPFIQGAEAQRHWVQGQQSNICRSCEVLLKQAHLKKDVLLERT